jgi:hypothetical protein
MSPPENKSHTMKSSPSIEKAKAALWAKCVGPEDDKGYTPLLKDNRLPGVHLKSSKPIRCRDMAMNWKRNKSSLAKDAYRVFRKLMEKGFYLQLDEHNLSISRIICCN